MAAFGERAFGRRAAVTGAGVLGALGALSRVASAVDAPPVASLNGDEPASREPGGVPQRPASDLPDVRDLTPADESVLRFFGHVRPGSKLARWSVTSIFGIHLGAIAVILEDANGTKFQVDVLRRDLTVGAPSGIGSSTSFTVFLANAGNGSTQTVEDHGIAALAIVSVLTQNEASHPLPSDLCTMRRRLDSMPTGSFSVLG